LRRMPYRSLSNLEAQMTEKQDPEMVAVRRIITIRLTNESGAVARVMGLFSARGWNINSLTLHEEFDKVRARITLVFHANDMLAEQIVNQIRRLVPVHKVMDLTHAPDRVEVVTVLLRLLCTNKKLRQGAALEANRFEAQLRSKTDQAVIYSKTGSEELCAVFTASMSKFGTVQTNGSGVVAIA
jgi:acetolactate synthase I/III small subunit